MLRSPLPNLRKMPAPRQMPLRLILVVPFVVQVSIAVGLTGWLSIRNGQQAVNNLAGQLRNETTRQVDYQISDFLTAAQTLKELIVKAVEREQIDLSNIRSLEEVYWSYLTSFETVSGLGVGNRAGDIMALFQQLDAQRTQYFFEYSDDTTDGQYISTLLHSSQEVVRSTVFDQQIDSRTRPWYVAAIAAEESIWTAVYPSVSKSVDYALLINLSTAIRAENGEVEGVANIILDLRTISQFLENLELSPSAQVYILQPDGRLVGSSDGQNPVDVVDGELVQRQAVQSQTPLIRASAIYLSEQFADLGSIRQPQQLEFWLEGERQFLQLTPLSPENGLGWLIVVVVPEADFMAQIQANTRNTVLLCLAALGMAIAFGLITSRWITAPLLRLSKAAGAIATGDLNQRVDSHGSQEFRSLAGAFNHMARQLQTLFLNLQKSEERFRRAVTEAPFPIVIHAEDGEILQVNQTWVELTGYAAAELPTVADWTQRAYGERQEVVKAGIDRLYSLGSRLDEGEFEIRTHTGEIRIWDFSTTPLGPLPDGRRLVMSIAADVTRRKQAEAALQQTNQELEQRVARRTAQLRTTNSRLSLALRAANAGIWEWDMATNRTFWSEENYRLLGYEPGSCESTYENWLRAIHPGDRERVHTHVLQVVEQRCSLDMEYRVLLPDGQIRWIADLGEILCDDQGQPGGMAGLQVDITQRKQAEEQLRLSSEQLSLANAELSRAARLKDEFLAGMSHELRTPLNSILGLSEALLDHTFGELNDQQHEFLKIIRQSGCHLLDLINDILDLSKVQSGRMELHIAPVPVRDICAVSLDFVKQQAHQKRITLTCDIADADLEIDADERRIRQVLINLLNNAVKFTPSGGSVKLQVSANALQEAVEFRVTDTGIGIAPKDMSRLFQPFVQLDSGLARHYEGTGLGLALVRKITELHGGSVSLTSTVGEGSCFTVTLPRSSDDSRPFASSSADSQTTWLDGNQPSHPSPAFTASSKPLLILLAEDNEANIMVMTAYLRHHDAQVMVARNGLEAICLAEQQPIDLILMDIQMPEMDGLTAIRKIRQMMSYSHTPIIALTALAMPGDCDRCLEAGATVYLTKPVSLKQLSALIEKIVSNPHAD